MIEQCLELGSRLLAGAYVLVSVALALYGLNCLYLLLARLRAGRRGERHQTDRIEIWLRDVPRSQWPRVTTQLPIYNEAAVAERALRAAAALRYPADLHEIQLLDDSTDETRDIVDRVAAELRDRGATVHVLRRATREGYKAGALAAGAASARGDLLAIFDADFMPPPDFLERAIALLCSRDDVGCVQGRWEHANRRDNLLTRAVAAGMDGHFGVEQSARCGQSLFLNFNGTAGVWRKSAIEDAGGWRHDTVTEDLDLSYRAQLKGWCIEYCPALACPAEVPSNMRDLKCQQSRWAAGTAQTARLLLPDLLRSRLPLWKRAQAALHLGGYFVSWLMIVQVLMSLPLLALLRFDRESWWMSALWLGVLFTATLPLCMYAGAAAILRRSKWTVIDLPALMILGLGLSLNNAVAVARGLFSSREIPFLRTPKHGGGHRRYASPPSRLWVAELLLAAYSGISFYHYAANDALAAGGFMALYCLGFAAVGLSSMPERNRRPALSSAAETSSTSPLRSSLKAIEHA